MHYLKKYFKIIYSYLYKLENNMLVNLSVKINKYTSLQITL